MILEDPVGGEKDILHKFMVHCAPNVRKFFGTDDHRLPVVVGIQAQTHLLAQRGHILGVVSQLALHQNGSRIRPNVCFFPPSQHQNF